MALSERAMALVGKGFRERMDEFAGETFGVVKAATVARACTELQQSLLADPGTLVALQADLWRDTLTLWQGFLEQQGKSGLQALVPQPARDRRFADPAWSEEPYWATLQQGYRLFSDWLLRVVEAGEVEPATRRRLRFYARQLVNASAPTNFWLTNPEALRRAAETGGVSLVEGLRRFVEDLERGHGQLRMRQTDENAFRLGENVAITPGKVIFKNALMELLHYAPTRAEVRRRPLLIVPPWINKYYILDLQPENSFIAFALAEGFDVFLISWANPDHALAKTRFEDYLRDGPLAALDAIEQAIGERQVNVLGFCIGGILTATALAHLAGQDEQRVLSATFLATLFDFTDVGEIGVFIDHELVAALEEQSGTTGFLPGRYLSDMFSMLRENDLIWSFFVRSYLLGKPPPAFDLLYWNSDTTRLPAAMLSDYLRKFYLDNAFARPGHFQALGTPIDTRRIAMPVYALATVDDHIAPWRSCFPVVRQIGGPVRFVLGNSGHIAGIVNPPTKSKYGYRTNDGQAEDAETWLESSTQHTGSWWPDWADWLHQHSGEWVNPRVPGAGGLAPLADAPGSYVRVRHDDDEQR